MIVTKCSLCDSMDDFPMLIGYRNAIDPTSDILENGIRIRKIENYVTVCKDCGATTVIQQSDDPDEIGHVNFYEESRTSETGPTIRKFTANDIKDYLNNPADRKGVRQKA